MVDAVFETLQSTLVNLQATLATCRLRNTIRCPCDQLTRNIFKIDVRGQRRSRTYMRIDEMF